MSIEGLTFEVQPLQGVAGALFGMSPTQIEKVLGPPDESRIDIQEDFANLSEECFVTSRKWQYNDLGISLSFTAPDDRPFDTRFRSCEIVNPRVEVLGTQYIGLSEAEFLEAVAGSQLPETVLCSDLRALCPGDPEYDVREYICDQLRITFWIEQGVVASIWAADEWRPTSDIKERPGIHFLG